MTEYKVTYQVKRWYGKKTEVFYTYAHGTSELMTWYVNDSTISNVVIAEVQWYHEIQGRH